MSFRPRFLATGVGSMPFTDAAQAVEISLSRFRQAPFWPQLPKRGLTEQMEIQYSEILPCAVIDYEKGRMYFDTSGDYSEAFAQFYEVYMMAMDSEEGNGDCGAMAISADFSAGLHQMKQALAARREKLPFIKVQTTGPCSMGLSLVDENKRAIYYNEEFRDMLVKAMAMKCRWQIQEFQPFAERIICFIDEPILSAFGSSTYVSVERSDIVSILNEVVEAVHRDNGLAGVHCCGNTEWSIPIDGGADIVNFDAYGFGESILMYPDAVQALFSRNGALAWGIVPTSPAVRQETVESLESRLEALMQSLAAKGLNKSVIADQALITPSCGTGSMEIQDAQRVFELTQALSLRLRERYGF